jgi:hypothetical protein
MQAAPVPTASRPMLSDEDLRELVKLIADSDTVELKLTVPDSNVRSTIIGLGMDPLEAQIRQVFFFDTPDLILSQNGVVVRARRIGGKGEDTVVKLRPVVPSELPRELRETPGFGVEVDALPGGFVCSGRLKVMLPKPRILRVTAGEIPAKELFTREQRRLFHEHAPPGLRISELSVLGPIFVLKLQFTPADFDRKLVAELWLYPDGSRLLELSTKCTPKESFQVATEARVFLSEHGVDLYGEQETKTRKALAYFASELKKQAKGG